MGGAIAKVFGKLDDKRDEQEAARKEQAARVRKRERKVAKRSIPAKEAQRPDLEDDEALEGSEAAEKEAGKKLGKRSLVKPSGAGNTTGVRV